MDRIVARQPPFDHSAAGTVDNNWHLDAFLAQPNGDLADAAEFGKLAECQVEYFAFSFVLQLQPIVGA
jgi:hypothetical protein